jgi:hypothetical protein
MDAMKTLIKRFIQWIPLTALLMVGFNNCGSPDPVTTNEQASLGEPAPETDSEKLGIPYALLSAEQTLSSMLKVTNVTAAPAAVTTEYNSRYGALAAGNDLSMANAPLMLSSTSLAGEVCNTLVTQEKALAAASRSFFGGVNFAAGISSIDETAMSTSIRGMARSFWGRNENAEEYEMLKQYKLDFTEALAANARTQAASSANVMTALCSAMLSSLDAITY